MMNRKKQLTAWFTGAVFATLGLLHSAMAADALQASVSANKVGFGETVTLTLTADSDQLNSRPDLTPLENDFDLVSQSTSSQTQIINGNRSATVSWILTLVPKSKGSLEIPAISAGSATSNSLTIDVVDVAEFPAGTSPSQALHVEVMVDDKPHYVHGEIPVTVQVIDAAGMTQATLQAPTGKDFTLRQSGEDQYQQRQLNGRPVTVMQRQYLLTPLKSGELTLPPVQLQGMVPTPDGNRMMTGRPSLPAGFGGSLFGPSLFDQMFNRGQQVRVQSDPVALTIKASPVSDSSWFLPAKDVQISAEWAQGTPEFKVGEAASRTVRLLALGAAQEKLPNLTFEDTDGARIYLDRSDDKSADTAQGTAAVREFKLSIVPTRSGDIELPAIDVSWWDTETDQQRTASLPAETISVAGAAATSNATANSNTTSESVVPEVTSSDADMGSDAWLDVKTVAGASVLVLFGALASFALYRRSRRSANSDHQGKRSVSAFGELASENDRVRRQRLKTIHRQVVDACKAGQPEKAYASYGRWLTMVEQTDNLALRNSQALRSALNTQFSKLEEQLYQSNSTQVWQGREFLEAFEKYSAVLGKNSKGEGAIPIVPALYPAQAA